MSRLNYTQWDYERRFPDRPDRERHQRRSPFEVDKARIVHGSAFRRLQGKTQVLGAGQRDFYRTRLTHSLEVAQLGRGLCHEASGDFEPDPDLVEAICLGHDIGHPPFGHAGERCLDDLLREHGGFNANAQNLRIVNYLEGKHPEGGLNLTRATLDGLIKYSGSVGVNVQENRAFIYGTEMDLLTWTKGDTREIPIEGQIADWVDTVAYSVDDIEDNLRAGLVDFGEMKRRATEISEVSNEEQNLGMSSSAVAELAVRLQDELLDRPVSYRERRVVLKDWTSRTMHDNLMQGCVFIIRDPSARSDRYKYRLQIPEANIRFANGLKATAQVLVFRDPRLRTLEHKGTLLLQRLFDELSFVEADGNLRASRLLPYDYQELLRDQHDQCSQIRIVADFLAGMTERYAMEYYSRLFVPGSGTYDYF